MLDKPITIKEVLIVLKNNLRNFRYVFENLERLTAHKMSLFISHIAIILEKPLVTAQLVFY